MKLKLMLAALAAATTLTAMPASAQRYYGGGDIVVRHDAGTFRFDRNDPEYWRLVNRFGFRPGYRYEYTHECNHYGCNVVVYRGGGRRERIFAPYFANAFRSGHVPGNRDDNRYDRRGDWRS